jgi:hypothetical protein
MTEIATCITDDISRIFVSQNNDKGLRIVFDEATQFILKDYMRIPQIYSIIGYKYIT